MSLPLHACRALFASLLRGEQTSWPSGLDVEAFIDLARFHGIAVLLLGALECLQDAPPTLAPRLRALGRERAMWELRNRQLLQEALAALAAAGIPALLYKGSALAYGLYPNPVWRMRSDSDLLIDEARLGEVCAILLGLGYRQYLADDETISAKYYFEQVLPDGGVHNIDLHWRLSNSECLSACFDFRVLYDNGVPLPALGTEVRTLGDVDALLLACLHRGVHQQALYEVDGLRYYTGDRYIWFKDIDLLARRLSPAGWQQLALRVRALGLEQSCADSLQQTQALFGTPDLPPLLLQTRASPAGPADRYLQASPLQRGLLDLHACRGLAARLHFLRRHLLPPAAYMHSKYADARLQWLPWLYLRRILEGLRLRLHGPLGQT